MESNVSIGVLNPQVWAVAENLQELVEGCCSGIGLQVNSNVICDLSSYTKEDFNYEIIRAAVTDDELLTLYFGKRELCVQDIQIMDIYKSEDDRITQITLTCGDKIHVLSVFDMDEA